MTVKHTEFSEAARLLSQIADLADRLGALAIVVGHDQLGDIASLIHAEAEEGWELVKMALTTGIAGETGLGRPGGAGQR